MKIKLIAALIALSLLIGAITIMQMQVPKNMQQIAAPEIRDNLNAPPFPDIIFQTPEGKNLKLADIPERGVLVHFWAAWCAPCRAEFPDLLKYIANSNGKIALLAVSLDDDYATSRKMLESVAAQNHLDLNAQHLYWAWDKDKAIALHQFNTVKVPETIMVDSQRRMADKIVGPGPWSAAAKSDNTSTNTVQP